jgi:hypothetical protein
MCEVCHQDDAPVVRDSLDTYAYNKYSSFINTLYYNTDLVYSLWFEEPLTFVVNEDSRYTMDVDSDTTVYHENRDGFSISEFGVDVLSSSDDTLT